MNKFGIIVNKMADITQYTQNKNNSGDFYCHKMFTITRIISNDEKIRNAVRTRIPMSEGHNIKTLGTKGNNIVLEMLKDEIAAIKDNSKKILYLYIEHIPLVEIILDTIIPENHIKVIEEYKKVQTFANYIPIITDNGNENVSLELYSI
jgi:hypothetical protein